MNKDSAVNPGPKKPSLLRRTFLIQKGEQLKVALYLSSVIALFIVISSVVLHRLLGTSLESVMFTSHIKIQKLGEAFMPVLIKVNIVYFLAVMAVSWGLVVFLIYRLHAALRRLHFDIARVGHLDLSHAGRFGRIKLMENMKDAFNEMVSSLGGKMASLSASSDKISALTGSDDIDIAGVKKEIKSIKDTLDRLSPP
jgi:methyl-accepting chemotaxis protein